MMLRCFVDPTLVAGVSTGGWASLPLRRSGLN
jgi:hypothetical protein